MPREDTATQTVPPARVSAEEAVPAPDVTDTPRRRLQDLADLIAQTPGWAVSRRPDGGYRIAGPNRTVLNVMPDAGIEELAALQTALTKAGWSWVEAEAHVARLQAIYQEKAAHIPSGGYPKEDRVVTRPMARKLIQIAETCGCNWRPIKTHIVKEYTDVMNEGEWPWYSPEVMILSKEHGCPLDGRQRLEAFLRSSLQELGVSFILDYPKDQFRYLNHGSKRSATDILAGAGLQGDVRRKVGPMVKLAMGFDGGTPWTTWKGFRVHPLKLSAAIQEGAPYAEMPGKPYNDAVTLGWNPRDSTGCKMLPAVAGTLSFIVRRDWPKNVGAQEGFGADPWEEFRTALVYGDNLPRGDARSILRNQLLGRDPKATPRDIQALQLGQALTAWAYWLNEVPGDQIKFGGLQKMTKVWTPGMPLPGSDPRRGVQNRRDRYAARMAEEAGELPDLSFDGSFED